MYKTLYTEYCRLPLRTQYSNKDLIGKIVRVISNASYKHYKDFGRIVGFTKNGDYAKVYFDQSKTTVNFCRGSLEIINL